MIRYLELKVVYINYKFFIIDLIVIYTFEYKGLNLNNRSSGFN